METWSNESAVSSKVTFSPTPEDDGHVLKCQAINPSIPAAPLEDFLTLNVVCKYPHSCKSSHERLLIDEMCNGE